MCSMYNAILCISICTCTCTWPQIWNKSQWCKEGLVCVGLDKPQADAGEQRRLWHHSSRAKSIATP